MVNSAGAIRMNFGRFPIESRLFVVLSVLNLHGGKLLLRPIPNTAQEAKRWMV